MKWVSIVLMIMCLMTCMNSSGENLGKLEDEKGIVVRFMIGHR